MPRFHPQILVKTHIFYGRRLFLSKGPYRCLLDGADRIPLFDVNVCYEPDPDDYLLDDPVKGPDPDYLAFSKSLESGEADPGEEPELG